MRHPVFDMGEESDEDEEEHYVVKNVVVVGKQKCGKTSIITRLVRSNFTLCYTPTKSIEIYPPVKIGEKFYKFYEIPYSYDFQHKWFLEAHIVFIVEDIDTEFWVNFLSTVNTKHYMEVFFLTQKKDLKQLHRQYHVNALEFSGFSNLMYNVDRL